MLAMKRYPVPLSMAEKSPSDYLSECERNWINRECYREYRQSIAIK
jgi:hypothetical protein